MSCLECKTRPYCLPPFLQPDGVQKINNIVSSRIKVLKGQTLLTEGMPFYAVYIIRTGFFKTVSNSINGHLHLVGFHMSGDKLGLDGVVTNKQTYSSIALEDSSVCTFPFHELENLASHSSVLQRHIHIMLIDSISRENKNLFMKAKLSAEERIASFIQNLIMRLFERGFSSSVVHLRMSRIEISQYLGLTFETVSRELGKLSDSGVISVQQRNLRITNIPALEKITGVAHCI